ncbi:MAG: hypothetical protein WKG01_30825 [Kofleriaceae bacterium]
MASEIRDRPRPAHPTVVAAHAIVDGTAALAQIARSSRALIVLVDAGARETAASPTRRSSRARPTRTCSPVRR